MSQLGGVGRIGVVGMRCSVCGGRVGGRGGPHQQLLQPLLHRQLPLLLLLRWLRWLWWWLMVRLGGCRLRWL